MTGTFPFECETLEWLQVTRARADLISLRQRPAVQGTASEPGTGGPSGHGVAPHSPVGAELSGSQVNTAPGAREGQDTVSPGVPESAF